MSKNTKSKKLTGSAKLRKAEPKLPAVPAGVPSKSAGNGVRKLELGQLLLGTGIGTAALKRLQEIGLRTVGDVFAKGKARKLKQAGLEPKHIRLVLALAKFSLASGDPTLAEKLTRMGIRSLWELAAMPEGRIFNSLGKLSATETKSFQRLYAAARGVSAWVSNASVVYARTLAMDATWHVKLPTDMAETASTSRCTECECCNSVFSLRAYVFDLLDLIYFWWTLPLDKVAMIILQPFDAITTDGKETKLDCEELDKTLPQTRIAVEVLEAYLMRLARRLPTDEQQWRTDFERTLLTLVLPAEAQIRLAKSNKSFTFTDVLGFQVPVDDPPLLTDQVKSAVKDLSDRFGDSDITLAIIVDFAEKAEDLVIELDDPDENRRASAEAARNWAVELLGRNPDEMFQERLDSAIRQWLVDYREALIRACKEDRADLARKLCISLSGSGCQTTTRMTQLIVSLQTLILNIRTGEFIRLRRADLSADDVDFSDLGVYPLDERNWSWLANFQEWLGATYRWIYPENLLQPVVIEDSLCSAAAAISQATADEAAQAEKEACDQFKNMADSFRDSITTTTEGAAIEARRHYLKTVFPETLRTTINGWDAPGIKWALDWAISDGKLLQTSSYPLTVWLATVVEKDRKFLEERLQNEGHNVEVTLFSDLNYRRRRDLFFPLLAGSELSRVGEYAVAHNWYRLLYDPERPQPVADIFASIDAEIVSALAHEDPLAQAASMHLGEEWFLQPHDPVTLADNRRGVWLRYAIMSMVRNLLAWADHEYALETPESIERARSLYDLAQRVLQAPDLGGECFQTLSTLWADIVLSLASPDIPTVVETTDDVLAGVHDARPDLRERVRVSVIGELEKIHSHDLMQRVARSIRTVLASSASASEKFAKIIRLAAEAVASEQNARARLTLGMDCQRRRDDRERFENALCFQGGAAATPDDAETLSLRLSYDRFAKWFLAGEPRGGMTTAVGKEESGLASRTSGKSGVSDDFKGVTVKAKPVFDESINRFAVGFCVPSNPLLKALDRHIRINLFKLDHCLSIVGEPLPPAIYTCGSTDQFLSALYGQFVDTTSSYAGQGGAFTAQPRYRYGFLVEKARQYVDTAQRLGAALLIALEKKDDAAFREMTAKHGLELASATVTLRRLGQTEAIHTKEVALLQQKRAETSENFWSGRVDGKQNAWESMSDMEKTGLGLMLISGILQAGAAGVSGSMIAPAIVGAAVSGGITAAGGVVAIGGGVGAILAGATGVGAVAGVAAAYGGAITMTGGALAMAGSIFAGGPYAASMLQSAGGAAGTFGSAALTYANFERRFEEWKLQRELADFDVQITKGQVILADDRIGIATQELTIANLQQAHAREELNFLKIKNSNVALYAWMINVLLENYRALMQVATSVARLAQSALEFERQEPVLFIRGDYWSVDPRGIGAADLTIEQRRFGLLGAERLLTDLTKLDAYKIQTDKRRLQISKTISFARILPTELVHLRENGSITFNTLLDWFDADFPGQYLRLIKCVKVSILALVPPIDGIHAMLRNTGESSVVVKENGEFVRKRAARNFGEVIALDGAFNETGLFVLNYDDPMFLPFEGLGVETQWTLELPKNTNRFDFSTLVDVFFTIEYTAEHDDSYAAVVRDRIRVTAAADVAIPLRAMFPDQWYHFANPTSQNDGFTFTIDIRRQQFPPHLATNLATTHLTLIIVSRLADVDGDARKALLNGTDEADGIAVQAERDNLPSTFSIHSNSPVVAFGNPTLSGDNCYIYSTRSDNATLPATANPDEAKSLLSLALNPVGSWTIKFPKASYTLIEPDGSPTLLDSDGRPSSPDSKGRPLVERIQEVVLVVSAKNSAGL